MVARGACIVAAGIGLASGCASGSGDGPRELAAFQLRALTAISNVTQAGIGYSGHAMLRLRYGMSEKAQAAEAGAVGLGRDRAPRSVRSLNARLVTVLSRLHRDFVRATRLGVRAALVTDAADVQRLIGLRSVVQSSSAY
jgi:hypothetical protein